MSGARDMGRDAGLPAEVTEIVYGRHAARHAFERRAGEVRSCWLQEGGVAVRRHETMIRQLESRGVPVLKVPREDLDRIAGSPRHQGIVLQCAGGGKRQTDLAGFLARETGAAPLILVLDGIQDPHNLGACLRSAEAAGADGVIIPRNRAVDVNETVRKVSSGAADHIPVIRVTNLARCLVRLQQNGIWVIGTAHDAPDSLYDVDLSLPMALVLGAEERGLRRNTREHCDRLVHIPMAGTVENLNVSVAAGVCLFEARRQRG